MFLDSKERFYLHQIRADILKSLYLVNPTAIEANCPCPPLLEYYSLKTLIAISWSFFTSSGVSGSKLSTTVVSLSFIRLQCFHVTDF